MSSTTLYGDNKFAPGVSHERYVPDQLVIVPGVTQPILVNAGVLKRGTVLGEISAQGIEAAPPAGNTGNGTIGAVARSAGSKEGAYVLTATDATHFSVVDPEGAQLPAATVGQAYNQQGVQFTITAGATAFVVGDKFTLNSADATGQYIACVKTAADGSQVPKAILVDDVDASTGPVTAGAYLTGEYNARAVLYDASWTVALLRDALRPFAIFLKASVSAAEPLN